MNVLAVDTPWAEGLLRQAMSVAYDAIRAVSAYKAAPGARSYLPTWCSASHAG